MQIKTKFIQNGAVTTAKIADANVTSAKLASDLALSGNPTAATQSAGDSSTKLATTAFVQTAVSNAVQGLDPKESVRVATTANITLSGEQTIDGVLTSGNRVLVKNQTDATENGIYVSASGAWSRAADADNSPSGEVTAGMFCFVEEGSTLAETGWVLSTNNPITLGSTSLAFVQFNGAASIIAGAGLTKSGNTLDVGAGHGIQVDTDSITVALDGATLSKSASGLKVADGGIANAQVSASAAIAYSKLALTNSIVAGDLTSGSVTTAKIADDAVTLAKLGSDLTSSTGGLKQEANQALSVKIALNSSLDPRGLSVDASGLTVNVGDATVSSLAVEDVGSGGFVYVVTDNTTIEPSATGLQVKDLSISTGKLADGAVTTVKIAAAAVDREKIAADVAGNGLSQAAGGELDVNVDGSTIEINTDALRVKDGGISAAKLASDSVTTIKILDANVTAAKLATDSVTTTKIADGNVTTAKLADGSVSTAKLADDSVTSAKIANDAVGATEIAAGSISNSHVNAAAAIAYSKLALSNSIVAGDLTSDSVVTAKIQDSAVTAGKLASDSVTTIKILDANVTAAKLASDSVTTAKIVDANVTAAKLASDSVTTAKIVDANVTAAKLASDSVTTAKILDANVTNAKLAGSITGDKLLAARYTLTLVAGDITNQYIEITATHKLSPESVELMIDGVMQAYGVDYDIDNSGSQSKIRFDSTNLPSSDLATGGAAALVATDKLFVRGLRIA